MHFLSSVVHHKIIGLDSSDCLCPYDEVLYQSIDMSPDRYGCEVQVDWCMKAYSREAVIVVLP